MEKIRFIFWEILKAISLGFLGLLAAQAVASLRTQRPEYFKKLMWVRSILFSAILALVVLGAWDVGHDIAAELYVWASETNLEQHEPMKAYSNALRAVQVRPGVLRHWRALATAKVSLGQFASTLDDLPAFQAVAGGSLDEADIYRFVVCHFFLGQYGEVITSSQQIIRANRFFAAPYVMQGMAYLAEKKYTEAEGSFLAVLQMFPNHQAAVEGLAQAYFLAGDRARALVVLNETAKYSFPPEARKRFEALKGLYGE